MYNAISTYCSAQTIDASSNLHMLVPITHKVQDYAINLESESVGESSFDVIETAVEFSSDLVLVDCQVLDCSPVAKSLELFWWHGLDVF